MFRPSCITSRFQRPESIDYRPCVVVSFGYTLFANSAIFMLAPKILRYHYSWDGLIRLEEMPAKYAINSGTLLPQTFDRSINVLV